VIRQRDGRSEARGPADDDALLDLLGGRAAGDGAAGDPVAGLLGAWRSELDGAAAAQAHDDLPHDLPHDDLPNHDGLAPVVPLRRSAGRWGRRSVAVVLAAGVVLGSAGAAAAVIGPGLPIPLLDGTPFGRHTPKAHPTPTTAGEDAPSGGGTAGTTAPGRPTPSTTPGRTPEPGDTGTRSTTEPDATAGDDQTDETARPRATDDGREPSNWTPAPRGDDTAGPSGGDSDLPRRTPRTDEADPGFDPGDDTGDDTGAIPAQR
jgi:hypothetical protein